MIRYATLCSGIEGVSVAWEPLGGFEPVWFSEIKPFPCAVLKHHWPAVPNLGDMTKIDGAKWRGKVDVLWGSTPCQSFSAAGQRGGVEDERGALTLKFAELADEIDPAIVAWENVKGALSDKHNAFGCLVGALAGGNGPIVPDGRWANAGYVIGPTRVVAWRVLDAKYGGVPQQRRRVFVVACPSGGADPRQILFERQGGWRHSAPSRPGTSARSAPTEGRAPIYFNSDSRPKISTAFAAPLKADTGSGGRACILGPDGVPRRLTPLEWERLQGFEDGWTDIPGARDSERWSALGNSLAVPDVKWIGHGIKEALTGVKRRGFGNIDYPDRVRSLAA